MTQIKFAKGLFSREEEDSIAHVLSELVSDGRDGLWREAADEISIRRRIAGGRSGAEVLEADVVRGNSRVRLQWWGTKLIGEIDSPYFLRFEIVGAPTPIAALPFRFICNPTGLSVELHFRGNPFLRSATRA